MLFIVIHQAYELWFKELIHETRHVQAQLESGLGPGAQHTLRRIRAILKTLVSQLDILETLTPLQYLTFRDQLERASGFQSAQFRELEALLGRRDRRVLVHYDEGSEARGRLVAAMSQPGVFDSFLRYLRDSGHPVPAPLLERDVAEPAEPSPELQDLLIAVYREDGEAAQLCESLVDLDEGLQEWRYRHVKMVERTIGVKSGTGGSTGAAYLRASLFNPVFPDLWEIRNRL